MQCQRSDVAHIKIHVRVAIEESFRRWPAKQFQCLLRLASQRMAPTPEPVKNALLVFCCGAGIRRCRLGESVIVLARDAYRLERKNCVETRRIGDQGAHLRLLGAKTRAVADHRFVGADHVIELRHHIANLSFDTGSGVIDHAEFSVRRSAEVKESPHDIADEGEIPCRAEIAQADFRAGRIEHLPTRAREVFDVSGAGDTVVATLACALASGVDLAEASALANLAAGVVVAKSGTAVVFAADLLHAVRAGDLSSSEAKIVPLTAALESIAKWRDAGQTIGFTNGCFDLLHPGHISLLRQSKSNCARLLVGLNSDASVRRLKGEDRPVQTESARAQVLASLETIDLVVIFSEDTPIKMIEAVRPDVLIKGGDYSIDGVVGADFVQSYGGKVLLAETEAGFSTSGTIEKLQR